MTVRVPLSVSVPKQELPIAPLLLTREETAQALRLSVRKVDQLTKEGELPSVRIDRAVRYLEADLLTFIRRKTAN